MADAFERFVRFAEKAEMEWFLTTNHETRIGLPYELRIFSEPRLIERGATPWEVAAIAMSRFDGSAPPGQGDGEA